LIVFLRGLNPAIASKFPAMTLMLCLRFGLVTWTTRHLAQLYG